MRALLFVGASLLTGCPAPEEPPPPEVAPDCRETTFNDVVYDCTTVDRCDTSPESIPLRVACCECDPSLCDVPDPGECPVETDIPPPPPEPAESCMDCHNGSDKNDYAGTGISNPHPVGGGVSMYLRCTQCHGGDGEGSGKAGSHVSRPPELGTDDFDLINDPTAYFNYLTRTGLDKFPDYTDPVTGNTWSAIDYIQFVNPGDVRVVSDGRACGSAGCHSEKAQSFARGPIATELGFYSNTMFTVGSANAVPAQDGLYENTASDYAFRAVTVPIWEYDPDLVGAIGEVQEFPEHAQYGDPTGFYQNPAITADTVANLRYAANSGGHYVNQVIPGSYLEQIVQESVAFQCGDCHGGSSGANNRYADFRSSGCTVCHMNYTLDGRSKSTDPNVPKDEPANPDAIAAPERPHIESHMIRNVAKFVQTATGPTFILGVRDNACVGCHQGSNRTVLQFWGIRLDQNQDLVNGFQYPTNPATFTNTAADTRLFDPAVQNQTFNGRNANQYILYEDYNGNGLDDTPEDIHYERGLGCIDCHGEWDLHLSMDWEDAAGISHDAELNGTMWSKMDQAVGTDCASCHGDADDYAYTVDCRDYGGLGTQCATDRNGNPLRNVTFDGQNYWLTSRLDGVRHYVPQTLDTIVDNDKIHPLTGLRIYSPNASYAMGAANSTPNDGVGPKQLDPNLYDSGFTHMETVSCDGCHASWNNNCIGCHLQLTYNDNANAYFFSNTTGERITVQVTNADFTYINPFWYFLEVTTRGMVGAGQPGMKAFYRYQDLNGDLAAGITFTDRNGYGANQNSAYNPSNAPALSHNRIYAHSIRGRQDASNEGPKQCVVCHLNEGMVADAAVWQSYLAYFDDMADENYNNLDFPLLQEHIGQNTQNSLNSPYYVHMVAGLGTGLLLVDANGCPVNPLDDNPNRHFCNGVSPADQFDIDNVAYNLDRVVELTGNANASFTKPLIDPQGAALRAGALNPQMSGPLGAELLRTLADPNTGLILDSWLDSAGQAQGNADQFILQGF